MFRLIVLGVFLASCSVELPVADMSTVLTKHHYFTANLANAFKFNDYRYARRLIAKVTDDINETIVFNHLVEVTHDSNERAVFDVHTPLVFAVVLEKVEMAKMLIEDGADVNVTSAGGDSPLIYAVRKESVKMAKMLIENGADVNVTSAGGDSPLIYAAYGDYVEIAKMLIENGADVNAQNDRGETALLRAIHNNSVETTVALIETALKCE